MKSLFILAAVALAPAPSVPPAPMSERPIPVVQCFKTGEQVSGMNKICFYSCLGSQAAITVGATQLCPLSIDG